MKKLLVGIICLLSLSACAKKASVLVDYGPPVSVSTTDVGASYCVNHEAIIRPLEPEDWQTDCDAVLSRQKTGFSQDCGTAPLIMDTDRLSIVKASTGLELNLSNNSGAPKILHAPLTPVTEPLHNRYGWLKADVSIDGINHYDMYVYFVDGPVTSARIDKTYRVEFFKQTSACRSHEPEVWGNVEPVSGTCITKAGTRETDVGDGKEHRRAGVDCTYH